jgi:hypothetical protein
MPQALSDGRLLKWFSNGFGGFTKTLEELDAMDQGRFWRAMEANDYADAWERDHEEKSRTAKGRQRLQKKKEAQREAEDRRKVQELVRIAAKFR